MARPKKPIELSSDERNKLEVWARRPKTSQALAQRARIILACARGLDNTEVAEEVGMSTASVCKWRERFRVRRLEGLLDEPRPGAPRKITDRKVEDIITQTLESLPRGQTHWSTREMARRSGFSADSISRIWRAFGLKPHLSESFKLSPDPYFVEKVRDIVGLYVAPPERAIVLCVDEKSQIQALDRTQPLLPLRPGQAERRTHDYVRHGTTTLFAALDVKTGKVISRFHSRHRQQEFIAFLQQIDDAISDDGTTIHLVLDNYGTHKSARVRRWLAKRPRFVLHFTPTYSSWLNLVERLFSELTNKAIRRGAHRSVAALKRAIEQFLDVRNEVPQPFKWTASADLILERVERVTARTYRTGH